MTRQYRHYACKKEMSQNVNIAFSKEFSFSENFRFFLQSFLQSTVALSECGVDWFSLSACSMGKLFDGREEGS